MENDKHRYYESIAFDIDRDISERIWAVDQIRDCRTLEAIIYKVDLFEIKECALLRIIVLMLIGEIQGDGVIIRCYLEDSVPNTLKVLAIHFSESINALNLFKHKKIFSDTDCLIIKKISDLGIRREVFNSKVFTKSDKVDRLEEVRLYSTLLTILLSEDYYLISDVIIKRISDYVKNYKGTKFYTSFAEKLIYNLFLQDINIDIKVSIYVHFNDLFKNKISPVKFLELDFEFKKAILPFIQFHPAYLEYVAFHDESEKIRSMYIPYLKRSDLLECVICNDTSKRNIKNARNLLKSKKLF